MQYSTLFRLLGVGILACSTSISFASEKGTKPEPKKAKAKSSATNDRYAVVGCRDSKGAVTYKVVPMSEANAEVKRVIEEGRKAAEDWRKLPSKERKKTPRPKNATARVVRSYIRGEEAAQKIADALTSKLEAASGANSKASEKRSKAKKTEVE